jgi:thiamine pyrophosphokinase
VTDPHPHVVIVGDGDVDSAELARLAAPVATAAHVGSPPPGSEAQARPVVLAADGGAARCRTAGIQPDIVIGDLDSLSPVERTRLQGLGVEIREADSSKDESDLELCLAAAIEQGASRITILGGLGVGRPEHSIANLLLLADPRLDGLDVTLVGHGSRVRRIGSQDGPGRAEIAGHVGDLVSLLPLGAAVHGVTTTGLRFPLRSETLHLGPTRGLSNEIVGSQAEVTTVSGSLLVVETPRSHEPVTGIDRAHEGTAP